MVHLSYCFGQTRTPSEQLPSHVHVEYHGLLEDIDSEVIAEDERVAFQNDCRPVVMAWGTHSA